MQAQITNEIIDPEPWWAAIDRDAVATEEARWEEADKLQGLAFVGPPVTREEFFELDALEQETLIGWLIVAVHEQDREEG